MSTSSQPENSSMMPIVVAVIIIIAIVLAVIFFSSNPNPNANNDGDNITNTTPDAFATSTMQDLGVTAQFTESNTSTTGDGTGDTSATDTGNNEGGVATENVPMVTGTAETGN